MAAEHSDQDAGGSEGITERIKDHSPDEVGPWVPIDEVHPYVNNPKEHPDEQVDKIRSSIKNYGWDQAIVVDEDHEIIKGHGRRLAAESLGMAEVPITVREDFTEGQKRAMRIADNRTAESDWSVDTLATELRQIQENEDLDLAVSEATGMDEDEVEDYFERQEKPDEDDWLDHFDDDKMEPDSSEDNAEDKKHITLLLPESRHEQLMDHLDQYDGGKDDSFIQWMDDTLGPVPDEGEPEHEGAPEHAPSGGGPAQEVPPGLAQQAQQAAERADAPDPEN